MFSTRGTRKWAEFTSHFVHNLVPAIRKASILRNEDNLNFGANTGELILELNPAEIANYKKYKKFLLNKEFCYQMPDGSLVISLNKCLVTNKHAQFVTPEKEARWLNKPVLRGKVTKVGVENARLTPILDGQDESSLCEISEDAEESKIKRALNFLNDQMTDDFVRKQNFARELNTILAKGIDKK